MIEKCINLLKKCINLNWNEWKVILKKKKKEVEKPACEDVSIFIFINVLTKNKNTKNTNIVFEWIKKMFKCQLY